MLERHSWEFPMWTYSNRQTVRSIIFLIQLNSPSRGSRWLHWFDFNGFALNGFVFLYQTSFELERWSFKRFSTHSLEFYRCILYQNIEVFIWTLVLFQSSFCRFALNPVLNPFFHLISFFYILYLCKCFVYVVFKFVLSIFEKFET